ncbi:TolC family protein [Draconibacterium halophilum]|uniref:TolC family protein n=1 Tax=Draconibacterium halophilum TaxID=2706887 RepID=A0A6C0R878_9BACT|nr:TolC family protein [Draconibacterium halophilum]QIA06588.1 TolC family protein [Draconibacterium halophilum]
MIKKRIVFIIVLYLIIGNTIQAQQKWSLNQCISYAIENNINLKEYEILEKLSLEDAQQAKRNMLPDLNASTSAGLNFGRSVDPNTNAYINTEFFNNTYNLSSSIAVFDGFRIQNRIKYQQFRKQASEYNRLNATDDLAFNVMVAFFDVVYYKGMLEIANEQVEASKLSLKTTEKKVEVGLKAKTDLLDMRANLEEEELNKIKIENTVETATLKLKQLMNYVSADEMELVDDSSIVVNEKVAQPQQLFEQYTSWSPYYQSIEANVNATEKGLALSRSALYPSLYANGSYNTGFYETNTDADGNTVAFGDQWKNNKNQYLGARLSIPIFNKWAIRSDVKKAKLELQQAKNNLDNERQKLFFEMVNNLTELEALYKEHSQYVKRTEVDQLAFQAAEKKFDQGLIDINDYYIAKNRLATTQSSVLRSRTLWEIKMKVLQFYRGQRFWEGAPSNSPRGEN